MYLPFEQPHSERTENVPTTTLDNFLEVLLHAQFTPCVQRGNKHRGCTRGQKDPLPKICHTYPTMMELGTVIPYSKKIQKNMNDVTHPLSSADIGIFSLEISRFCYIKKYRYGLYFDT